MKYIDKHERRTVIALAAVVCLLIAVILQVVIGVWFVLGLSAMVILVLFPVYCALYVYKSHFLLWTVALALVLCTIVFIEVMATSQVFNKICHDLGETYQNEPFSYSEGFYMTCNYHNEESISASTITSATGAIAWWGVVIAVFFNILQAPFAVVYVLRNHLRRRLYGKNSKP